MCHCIQNKSVEMIYLIWLFAFLLGPFLAPSPATNGIPSAGDDALELDRVLDFNEQHYVLGQINNHELPCQLQEQLADDPALVDLDETPERVRRAVDRMDDVGVPPLTMQVEFPPATPTAQDRWSLTINPDSSFDALLPIDG